MSGHTGAFHFVQQDPFRSSLVPMNRQPATIVNARDMAATDENLMVPHEYVPKIEFLEEAKRLAVEDGVLTQKDIDQHTDAAEAFERSWESHDVAMPSVYRSMRHIPPHHLRKSSPLPTFETLSKRKEPKHAKHAKHAKNVEMDKFATKTPWWSKGTAISALPYKDQMDLLGDPNYDILWKGEPVRIKTGPSWRMEGVQNVGDIGKKPPIFAGSDHFNYRVKHWEDPITGEPHSKFFLSEPVDAFDTKQPEKRELHPKTGFALEKTEDKIQLALLLILLVLFLIGGGYKVVQVVRKKQRARKIKATQQGGESAQQVV